MSNGSDKSILSDPKQVLTIIEITVLLVTLVWVFAFMRADVSANTETIKRHDERIQMQYEKQSEMEIKQAVTNEQYRQIIERLDELKTKLGNQ